MALPDLREGRPLVLDGGLATELESRGHDLSGGLWSARLLRDRPEAIAAAHGAFAAAGADIAVTATYQASFEGFAAAGIDRAETETLLRRSVDLARCSRYVAASIGPYGAALADGSEYRGRYGRTVAELAAWHRPRMELLAEAGADVLALETVPDVDEAEALLAVLDELDHPAWLSYSIDGDATRAGQPIEDAFALAAGARNLVAVGVNCCAPADVPVAIACAAERTGKPVIAYPNSGEGWNGGWTGPARFDPGAAAEWISDGARVVGGCCRVAPAEIATLAEEISAGTRPSS